MLRAEDLERFAAIVEEATARSPGSGIDPLVSITRPEAELRPSDLRRLAKMAEIACAAGDLEQTVAHAASRIALTARGGHLVALSKKRDWVSAARWAIDDLARMPAFSPPPGGTSREREVGNACKRLRALGHVVEVDGLGTRLDEGSRAQILASIDSLARVLGGRVVLDQLFRVLRDRKLLRDGMWLLGDVMPRIDQGKTPSLPFGWMLSLGIRHLGSGREPRNPAVAWDRLTRLMIDYVAVVDVERYSSLEGMNIAPRDVIGEFSSALGWHQLFTFPRYTPSAIRCLLRSMRTVLAPDERRDLGYDLGQAEAEIMALLSRTSDEAPIWVAPTLVDHVYPLLAGWPYRPRTPPNAGFTGPFDAERRDQERHFFLPDGPRRSILLPTAVTAAHAATLLVESIWRGLGGARAEKAVGRVCERAAADIVRRNSGARVRCDVDYEARPKNLQIDLIVERDRRITVLEVKAKALTARAQSGDVLKCLVDFKDSYLAMLLQLLRHGRHIRDGHPELPQADGSARIAKVAVSPLSYGPLSDASFNRAILVALAGIRLIPMEEDDKDATKAVKGIHKKIDEILLEMETLPTGADGKVDVLGALMDFHWLDIAQLEHLVARGDLHAELKRVRHASFATRDFWSESAFLDDLNLASVPGRP